MYRKYYSYNDMPRVLKQEPCKEPCKGGSKPEPEEIKKCEQQSGIIQNGKLFGRFETDDVILIIVAIILLGDACDDKLLLVALGLIFLTT